MSRNSSLALLPGAPTVGVVIPAYNAAPYVAQAVDSVLAQTYPVTEIIVVDDGSTDDCEARLTRYGGRVQYRRIENAGPAHARNVGIAAVRADLVAFLDADDVWLDCKLARQIGHMRGIDRCALVYCGKSLIDASGADLGPFAQHEFPQGELLSTLIDANHISTASAVLVRRDVLLGLNGFREGGEFRNCEDYELWLRIAARFNIGAVPEPLLKYRLHGTNSTRNMAGRYTGMLAALDSIAADLAAMGQLDPQLSLRLSRRRLSTHEQFARGFLYARDYSRARAAARSHAKLAQSMPPLDLLALRLLPDWGLDFARSVRARLKKAS